LDRAVELPERAEVRTLGAPAPVQEVEDRVPPIRIRRVFRGKVDVVAHLGLHRLAHEGFVLDAGRRALGRIVPVLREHAGGQRQRNHLHELDLSKETATLRPRPDSWGNMSRFKDTQEGTMTKLRMLLATVLIATGCTPPPAPV